KKAASRGTILKAISGRTWGQQKETMITTYRALVQSTIAYAAPVWAPLISDSHWKRIQATQNSCLRTATGCLAMASTAHLSDECKVMPAKQHNLMISRQFATCAARIQDHPSHHLSGRTLPP